MDTVDVMKWWRCSLACPPNKALILLDHNDGRMVLNHKTIIHAVISIFLM